MNNVKTRLALLAVSVVLASGVAAAADYVVVKSTDATIGKGTQYRAGESIPLAVGSAATLISSGGEVVELRGAAGGATLPSLSAGPKTASMEALTALVNRPAPRRSFGAMRGKEGCPAVETLNNVEAILAAAAIEGCGALAREALERYIASAEAGRSAEEQR